MWYFFQFFTIFHSRPWRYSLRWNDTWPGANVGIPTPHDGVIPPELGVKTSGGIVTVIAPCWTNRTLAFYGGIWDTDTVASYTTIPNWPTGIPYFKLGVPSLLKNLHISCKLLKQWSRFRLKHQLWRCPSQGPQRPMLWNKPEHIQLTYTFCCLRASYCTTWDGKTKKL